VVINTKAASRDRKAAATAIGLLVSALWLASYFLLQNCDSCPPWLSFQPSNPVDFVLRSAPLPDRLKNGMLMWTAKDPRGLDIMPLSFSPDGKYLASANSGREIKLWDTGAGTLLKTLRRHSGSVYAVAFSPDGKCLASASGDGAVKMWRAPR